MSAAFAEGTARYGCHQFAGRKRPATSQKDFFVPFFSSLAVLLHTIEAVGPRAAPAVPVVFALSKSVSDDSMIARLIFEHSCPVFTHRGWTQFRAFR